MKSIIDPVHQFISIPEGIINDLVDHPYVQRLRRISQLGMTHFVYPGATHSRFHHVLGALHLMKRAIDNLRIKGISISDEEEEATLIAILLHDIGHGPMSHALEFEILDQHHESITLQYMDELNLQFKGKLDLSIEIFTGKYSAGGRYEHEQECGGTAISQSSSASATHPATQSTHCSARDRLCQDARLSIRQLAGPRGAERGLARGSSLASRGVSCDAGSRAFLLCAGCVGASVHTTLDGILETIGWRETCGVEIRISGRLLGHANALAGAL